MYTMVRSLVVEFTFDQCEVFACLTFNCWSIYYLASIRILFVHFSANMSVVAPVVTTTVVGKRNIVVTILHVTKLVIGL